MSCPIPGTKDGVHPDGSYCPYSIAVVGTTDFISASLVMSDFVCPDCNSPCNIPDNYCSNCGIPLKDKELLKNPRHYDSRYLPKGLSRRFKK